MDIEVIPAAELTSADLRQWAQFQESQPSLDSPYFRPEFTQAVASVRSDVEVAVLREKGQTTGFFPFQRGLMNLARPVGGKLSDYHGIIGAPQLNCDVQDLLRRCHLAAWDFDHVVAAQRSFEPYWRETGESPFLELSRGFSAYARERKSAASNEISRIERKRRKLARERGPVCFEFHNPDPAVFRMLTEWKSAQYQRTGHTDLFSFPWTGELLTGLLSLSDTALSAVQSVLWHAGQPIAIHYGLRSAGVLHSWFASYSLDYASHSPGLLMLLFLAEESQQQGITKIDLGKGTERYKWSLASGSTRVAAGTVAAGGPAVWLMQGWRRTRRWVQDSRLREAAAAGARALAPLRAWLALH